MNETEKAMNLTVEDAIRYMEGMVFQQDFSPSTLKAVAVNKLCITALREKLEREKNEPLTPDRVKRTIESLEYYLKTNEENGVVYFPKFAIEKAIYRLKTAMPEEVEHGR